MNCVQNAYPMAFTVIKKFQVFILLFSTSFSHTGAGDKSEENIPET